MKNVNKDYKVSDTAQVVYNKRGFEEISEQIDCSIVDIKDKTITVEVILGDSVLKKGTVLHFNKKKGYQVASNNRYIECTLIQEKVEVEDAIEPETSQVSYYVKKNLSMLGVCFAIQLILGSLGVGSTMVNIVYGAIIGFLYSLFYDKYNNK